MTSRKLTYKEKSSIHFVETAEPKFIQKLKQQVGYKQVTIEDKFATTSNTVKEDNEDEINALGKKDGPQVVVLEEGDFTQEQLEAELKKRQDEKDREMIEQRKITFKKPVKRIREDAKKATGNEKKRKSEELKADKPNSRLLSFVDED